MDTPSRRLHSLLIVTALLSALLLQACASTQPQVRTVPEDGFAHTLHYQFRAQVYADSLGECQHFTVRVKALNKGYSNGAPPPRLRLWDDDCMRPIRFERMQYISPETGEQVRLNGTEVGHFWGENVRLQNELMTWMWRAGVI